MSLAPFAALESRLNSAVQKRLANVVQINSAGVAGTGQSGDMWRGE